LDTLITNLKGLDEFVQKRIDADNALEAVMARLPSLSARVRSVAEEAMHLGQGPADSTASATDAAGLGRWSTAGLEAITVMLTTPVVLNASRLERMRSELQELVQSMEVARGQLPRATQSRITDMHADIVQFGLGRAGLIEARRAQIEAESSIQTALRLIADTSAAFVGSVSAISSATEREIIDRSASFKKALGRFALLSIAASLLCLGAVGAVFVYVRRAVITRLKGLQQYMLAQVEGRPAAIPTKGADEITEMAKTTEVFVNRIAAAKDAAEGARDGRLGFSAKTLRRSNSLAVNFSSRPSTGSTKMRFSVSKTQRPIRTRDPVVTGAPVARRRTLRTRASNSRGSNGFAI
jgi:two-component system, sensor histidine kinase and response regulator